MHGKAYHRAYPVFLTNDAGTLLHKKMQLCVSRDLEPGGIIR